VGSFLNQSSDLPHQTSGAVLNTIYSVPNLVKNLQKLVQESVETTSIKTLPEDIAQPLALKDLSSWKLEKARLMALYLPESQMNLQFLNPYLKSNKALYTYRLILSTIEHNSDEDNTRFIIEVTKILIEFKKKLYEWLELNIEQIEKVLPLFHVLLTIMATHAKFSDRDKLRILAQESHELRMLPLPYGLLPHELIEAVDNERVIPGLTRIFKLAEDFPYLDHHR
jgi:hypothetical protein